MVLSRILHDDTGATERGNGMDYSGGCAVDAGSGVLLLQTLAAEQGRVADGRRGVCGREGVREEDINVAGNT